MNGFELGNHVVDTIFNQVGLTLKIWISAQQDRALTNKVYLREITEKFYDASPTRKYCCSHGMINAGKQALGLNGSAKYVKKSKTIAEINSTPWQGKARDRALEIFNEKSLYYEFFRKV